MVKTRAKPRITKIQLPQFEIIQKSKKFFAPSSEKTLNPENEKMQLSLAPKKKMIRANSQKKEPYNPQIASNSLQNDESQKIQNFNKDLTLANRIFEEKLTKTEHIHSIDATNDTNHLKENLKNENLQSIIGKLKHEESKALPLDWEKNFGKRFTRSTAFKLVNNSNSKKEADNKEANLIENTKVNFLNGIKVEQEEKESLVETKTSKEPAAYKLKKIENNDEIYDLPKNTQLGSNNINSIMSKNRGRLTRLIDFKLDSNLIRENSFIAPSTENLPRNSFISDLIHQNKTERKITKNNEFNALNRILQKKEIESSTNIKKETVLEEKDHQNIQIGQEKNVPFSNDPNYIQNEQEKNVLMSKNQNQPTPEKEKNCKNTNKEQRKKKKNFRSKGKKKMKTNINMEKMKSKNEHTTNAKTKEKNSSIIIHEASLPNPTPLKETDIPLKRSTRIPKPNTNFKDLFVLSSKREQKSSPDKNLKNNENEHVMEEIEIKKNDKTNQKKKKSSNKKNNLTSSQNKNLEDEVNRFFEVQYNLAEDKQEERIKQSEEHLGSEAEEGNSKFEEKEANSLDREEILDESSSLSSDAPNLTIPIRFSNSELSEVSSDDEEDDYDEEEFKEIEVQKNLKKKASSKKRDARPKKEGNPIDFDIFYENIPNLSNFFLRKNDEKFEIFRESAEKTSTKKNFLNMFNSKVNQQSIQEISLIAKKNAVFSLSAKDLDNILNSDKKDGCSNILQAFALDETLKSRILEEEKPKTSKENKNVTKEEIYLEDQNEIDSLNKSNRFCTPIKKRIRKRKKDILLEKLTFTETKSIRKEKSIKKEKPIKKEKKPKVTIFKIKRKRGRPINLEKRMHSDIKSENKREKQLRQKIINFPRKRGRRPGSKLETPIKPHLYWREAIKQVEYEKNNKKEIFRINEGIKLNSLLYEKEPVDFFGKFFEEEFFERLAEYTNASGRQEKKKTYLENLGKIWVDVSSDDIKITFGLLLLFGIVKIENPLDFWNDQSMFYMENVARLMSKEKFINIKRHLCFFDKTLKNVNLDDPLYKVRNLLNHFDDKNHDIYDPSNDLSFIEYLISYEGVKRPKDKDKMYKKPGKVEISALTLIDSDSGYVMKISLNDGIKILEPTDALPLLENYQGNKYRIFFDKYTFSEDVLTELKKQNFEGCCFMRGDQCTMKPEILNNIKTGQIDFYSNKELFASLWGKKTQSICLISNYEDFEVEKVVHSRKIGFLDNVSYKLYEYETPRIIYDYIENMKKSLKLDYVFNNFAPNFSSWKWNLRSLFFVLEVAINNSFILYQKSLKMRGLEHVNYFRFKMKIIKYLCNWDNAIIINTVREKQIDISDLKEITVPEDEPREEEMIFLYENEKDSNLIKNKNKPLISVESKCKLEYIGGGVCFTCKKRRKKIKKTVFWCKICQLGSCPECFDIHRTQTIFNRILNSQDSIMKFEIILETLIDNKCVRTDCVMGSKTKNRRRRRNKIEMLALRRQYNLETRKEREVRRKAYKSKKMTSSEGQKEEKAPESSFDDDFDLDYTIQKKKKRKVVDEQQINLVYAEKKSQSDKENDDQNNLSLIQNTNINMINEEEIFVEDKPYLIQENDKHYEDIINTQANEDDEYRILSV